MRALVIAVAGTIGLFACLPAEPTGVVDAGAAGDYVLRTLNDSALPRPLITRVNYLLEISSDTYFVTPDGRFRNKSSYRVTENGVSRGDADSLAGTWSVRGSTITFQSSTGNKFTGIITGTRMTIDGQGARAVYTK